MKHRLMNYVTSGSFQPWPAYAFAHIQQAYTEVFAAIMQGIIGATYSSSVPYVLYGCEQSFEFDERGFSAGAIFFNGEVYLSPAQTVPFNPPFYIGGIFVANIATAYADPAGQTVYTDTTVNQDCQILTCEFSYVPSGTSSTIGAYTSFVFLPGIPDLQQIIDTIEGEITAIDTGITTLTNNMANGTWEPFTFNSSESNNWSAQAGSAVQFRKNGMGNVAMQGKIVTVGTWGAASDNPVGTLPAGNWPLQPLTFSCSLIVTSGSTVTDGAISVTVNTNGQLTLLAAANFAGSSNQVIDLSAINFSTT